MIECFIAERDDFLRKEEKKVKKRGGVTGEYTTMILDELKKSDTTINEHDFLVSGACLVGCVSGTTAELLYNGAKSVTVDLTRCRHSLEVGGEERFTPNERLDLFRNEWRYPGVLVLNPRLFFITSWFGQK